MRTSTWLRSAVVLAASALVAAACGAPSDDTRGGDGDYLFRRLPRTP
ncbi:hypothetical protein [Longimycelium tulufanense]|nr:hypothetical protein [Longimycelium tulufanense]